MRNNVTKIIGLLALITLAGSGFAQDSRYSQDFEDVPDYGFSWRSITNKGWVVKDARFRPLSGYNSSSNWAALEDLQDDDGESGPPLIQSPLLSNGIGEVTFDYRSSKSHASSTVIELLISTNGAHWFTNSTINMPNDTAWRTNTTTLDQYEAGYIKIHKTSDGGDSQMLLVIDNILVTYPPAYVTVTNVTLSPDPQIVKSNVTVSATIAPVAGATNITAGVFYRTSTDASFQGPASMSSTGSNYYVTDSGIPGQDEPNEGVQYYVLVKFDDLFQGEQTNYYPSLAPDRPEFYQVQGRTLYTNMNVTGAQSTNMTVAGNYQWSGVLDPASALSNPSFQFSADSGTWGDSNPESSTLPVYGNAASGESIGIQQSVTNYLLFLLDETNNMEYSIQDCEFIDFEDWSGASGSYGSYTNSEGWVISGAKLSTANWYDEMRAYEGKFCMLKYGEGGGRQYVRSPYLPDGAGSIRFRYRHRDHDDSDSAGFVIQVSETGSGDWSNVAGTYTNGITSLGYRHFAANIGNLAAHYVRIFNTNSVGDSWLCLDEIVVTAPGAALTLGNPTINPQSPGIGESVKVSVSITDSTSGVTNETCSLYYRMTNSSGFAAIEMTKSNSIFRATIPSGPPGLVDYYFACNYEGFMAATAYYPPAGPPVYLSYTNSADLPDFHWQDFEDVPDYGFSWRSITNKGWVVKDARFRPLDSYNSSSNWAALEDLGDDDGEVGPPHITSPLFTNGIGTLYFDARSSKDVDEGITEIRVLTSTDGASWQTNASLSMPEDASWRTYTNTLNLYDGRYVRIIKISDGGASQQFLVIDDIFVSPPAADVAIEHVGHSPAYPSDDQQVTVYASVRSAGTNVPASAIQPTVYYTGGSAAMSGSGTNFQATIPAQGVGVVDYYVQCDFNGFYYTHEGNSENLSPRYSPGGAPGSQYSYDVKEFASEHNSVTITGVFGVVTNTLVDDYYWEGIVLADATNAIELTIIAHDFRQWSTDSSQTNAYGDNDQWLTYLPFVGSLATGGSNIVVTGSLEGQYVVRLDLQKKEYLIQKCNWQDFDDWPLDPTNFSDSAQGESSTLWSQNFNNWTLDSQNSDSSDFSDANWTNEIGGAWYTETTGGVGGDGWQANRYRIVNSSLPRRCELHPNQLNTWVRLWEVFSKPGLGTVSVNFRTTETNSHITVDTNGYNWTDCIIKASIAGSGSNSDEGTRQSIFYRYQPNGTNYYEFLLVQTNSSRVVTRLFKHSGGRTTLKTRTRNNSNMDISKNIEIHVSNSPTGVNHAIFYNDATWMNVTDNPGLNNSGTVGFDAYDMNMVVSELVVDHDGTTETNDFAGWSDTANWTATNGAFQRVGKTGDALGFYIRSYHPDNEDTPAIWTTHTNYTGLRNLDYQDFSFNIQTARESCVAIQRNDDGEGMLRINSVSVNDWRGRNKSSGGWTTWETWTRNYLGSGAIEMRPSRSLGFTNQYVKSPLTTDIGPIAMKYAIESESDPVSFSVEWDKQGGATNWITLYSVTNTDTGGQWRDLAFQANIVSAGYVRVVHNLTNGNGTLFVDDIRIYDYVEAGTSTWVAYNALLTGSGDQIPDGPGSPYRGSQSGYLNYAPDSNTLNGVSYTNYSPYIQTPYMAAGIGEIRLRCKRWQMPGGANHAKLRIEKASDFAGPWTLVFSTNVTGSSYERIVVETYDESNNYVRIVNDTSGAMPDRLCLDDILVVAPLATDLLVTNAWTDPAIPVYRDEVKVYASLSRYILNPSNITVSAHYYYGTNNWAAWGTNDFGVVNLPMECIATNGYSPPVYTYRSVGNIPTNPVNRTVQYFVTASFDGPLHTEITSPRAFKDGFRNPDDYEPTDYNDDIGGGAEVIPYYIVYSCPPGAVWFNEINLADNGFWTNEYIELCGPAGADIGNWSIELWTYDKTHFDTYSVPAGFKLATQTNGFGFWVLGDAGVDNIDAPLTNAVNSWDSEEHIPFDGGIRLVRSMGAHEYAICFGDNPHPLEEYGFSNMVRGASFDYGFDDSGSIQLTGTGSNYYEFSWSLTTNFFTPGAINTSQSLQGGGNGPPESVTVTITDYWVAGTNTWLVFSVSNVYSPAPWYSTNLMETNWYAVPSYAGWGSGSEGTYTQYFTTMTNLNAYYYKVMGTNAP